MLKAHKIALFSAIGEAGLDASRFELVESGMATTTYVKGANFTFQVEESPANSLFRFRYHTRLKGLTSWNYCGEHREGEFACTFDRMLQSFTRWLKGDAGDILQAEMATDPWAEVESFSRVFGYASFSQEDMSPFTAEEKAAVRASVLRFRLLIVEHYEPVEDQLKEVNERLDYLADAIERLNRFDWKSLALSTIISIGINMTIDTAGGQEFMRLCQQAFGVVVKLLTKGGA